MPDKSNLNQKCVNTCRTPWSCVLIHHVSDREVRGSNLAAAKFWVKNERMVWKRTIGWKMKQQSGNDRLGEKWKKGFKLLSCSCANTSIHCALTVFILLDLADNPPTIISCANTGIWTQNLSAVSPLCDRLSYEPLTILHYKSIKSFKYFHTRSHFINTLRLNWDKEFGLSFVIQWSMVLLTED